MATIPYINYGGDSTLPPPYQFGELTLYGFFYQGDIEAMQAMVDERLNFPEDSDYQFEVFSPLVMLSFAGINRAFSIPEQDKGYDQEHEVFTWVLLLEKKKIAGKWVPNRLVWMIPYIIVDNFWAIVSAREVYGFPKTYGQTTLPDSENPEQASYFANTVWGFETYSPDSLMQEYTAVSLTKDQTKGVESKDGEEGETKEEVRPWKDAKEAMKELRDVLIDEDKLRGLPIRFCMNELEDLTSMNFYWVFLKQFRAIENSEGACYQAITDNTFHLKLDTFSGGGVYPTPFTLDVPSIESYPMGPELGLTSGQKSIFGFWMKIDFECNTGRVLWEAQ